MTEAFFINAITWYIFFLGIFNLTRIAIFILGADKYRIQRLKRDNHYRQNPLKRFPFITVIVPAYNEGKTIASCIESFLKIDYPKNRIKVLIINDGSTDDTEQVVQNILHLRNENWIELITTKNQGKAHAVNTGIKNAPKITDIVTCMDSDCSIASNGILKIAQYFDYFPEMLALASHVNIIPEKSLLNLAQRFEYTVSYQMKRALTAFNIEYIIGGIGSSFRYKDLLSVNGYDTNTMTEDIDLTLKLMSKYGNKNRMVGYADDVMTYAEAVPDIQGLLKQRFRWKFGRTQTFFKNRNLFFNVNPKFSKWLTCLYLPLEVLFEFIFLFEPIIITWFLYLAFRFYDFQTIIGALIFSIFYVSLSVFGEDLHSKSSRINLILMTPLNFFINYAVSLAEYYALIKSLIKLPGIKKSLKDNASKWVSPTRTGAKL
jgi:poly-beta-1,6-N-acetyl-D-glucosamine synthase